MYRFIISIAYELKERLMSKPRKNSCSMAVLNKINKRFKQVPSALYATDVKFHYANRPQGYQQESKLYYSRKHHLYGYKTEVSVSPTGFAVYASKHHLGSRADISSFLVEKNNHIKFAKKQNDEQDVSDSFCYGGVAASWGILFGKGYADLQREFRAFVPKKSLPRRPLTSAKKKLIADICSHRIIVENWFGQLVSFWGLMFKQFRWFKEKHDILFIGCMSLTSYHVLYHPLRDDDGDVAVTFRKRYIR